MSFFLGSDGRFALNATIGRGAPVIYSAGE
jgi:hypothetical protein